MIDLRKAGLLRASLQLPYRFVMPNTLFEGEWLDLADEEKVDLCELGLEVRDLAGSLVVRAGRYFDRYSRLKLNDCFALTLAEEIDDCILLTGDGPLRRIAGEMNIEVRGVLWVTDQLEVHEIVPFDKLHRALQFFRDDEFVFLPKDEIVRRLRRLAKFI